MVLRTGTSTRLEAGVPVSITKCDSVLFERSRFLFGVCRFACIGGSLDSKAGSTYLSHQKAVLKLPSLAECCPILLHL